MKRESKIFSFCFYAEEIFKRITGNIAFALPTWQSASHRSAPRLDGLCRPLEDRGFVFGKQFGRFLQSKSVDQFYCNEQLIDSVSPVSMFWNAVSTFVESSADVSMKLSPLRSANVLASSVGTARKCRKSLLLPTNIITMFWSAWSRNSRSHLSTFS